MECNVVMDLIPLYIDEVVREDTKIFVNKHLQKCEKCEKYYKTLAVNKAIQIPSEEVNYMEPGKKFIAQYKYKLSVAALLLIIATYIVSYIINSDASAGTLLTLYTNILISVIVFAGILYGVIRAIKNIWLK